MHFSHLMTHENEIVILMFASKFERDQIVTYLAVELHGWY